MGYIVESVTVDPTEGTEVFLTIRSRNGIPVIPSSHEIFIYFGGPGGKSLDDVRAMTKTPPMPNIQDFSALNRKALEDEEAASGRRRLGWKPSDDIPRRRLH